jgi:signal transduction histidine kinase
MERERRFAADAAHELRSPLAEMRATVEVALRRPREAGEYRDALEAVASGLVRLQNLVVGLLQLTRGAGGATGRPVDLAAVLRHAAGGSQAVRSRARPGDFSADGVWVLGDPELLAAAVGNVLDNAARYAPAEAPTIAVETDGAGGTVRVVISDRGPGVPAADRERIFEPLTRLDAARTVAGVEGFGLGLAVARATARAFGGDLLCRARSDGAEGAEFVFSLRRAAAADEALPAYDATRPAAHA